MNAQQARWAGIGEAIERAAALLPEGYDLDIAIEQGAATVYLNAPEDDGPGLSNWEGDTLAAQINIAVAYAIDLERATS